MNKVILIGRLTNDPEVSTRNKADGTQLVVATYTLAVDRRRAAADQQQADFIRCKAFDSRAEFVEKYLRKGSKIGIVGKIQTGSYKREDGSTVYTTDVLVEEHEFCESKGSGAAAAAAPQQEAPQLPTDADGFMNIPDGFDEELPFN